MNKAQWFLSGALVCLIVLACMGGARYQLVPDNVYTAPVDPCDAIDDFLAVADPNWIIEYGDSERTKVLWNISVNRGLMNQNRKVIAEVAKRLLALEAIHKEELKAPALEPNDPNEVKE